MTQSSVSWAQGRFLDKDSILRMGQAARGHIKEMRPLGVEALGCDISTLCLQHLRWPLASPRELDGKKKGKN